MSLKTKAIVLSVIKYNDYDAIVKAFTEQSGFVTYFIRNFYKSNKGKLKKAYFQPAALLELITTNKNKGQLEYIKEVKVWTHYQQLNTNFDKLNLSVFMREIILESLKNEQADSQLFSFLTKTFVDLDTQEFSPDYHLVFMIQLTKYLGIAPSIESEGVYFDMQNGIFRNQMGFGNYINQQESKLLKRVLGTIFASKRSIKINNEERKKLIQIILEYYQLHVEEFKVPKSIKILQQIYQ